MSNMYSQHPAQLNIRVYLLTKELLLRDTRYAYNWVVEWEYWLRQPGDSYVRLSQVEDWKKREQWKQKR